MTGGAFFARLVFVRPTLLAVKFKKHLAGEMCQSFLKKKITIYPGQILKGKMYNM